MIVIDLFSLYATIGLKDDGFNKGINEAKGHTEGLVGGVKGLINTVAGIKLVSAAFDMVRNSVGGAVERYDTLNRFPRVLEQMGFTAANADASTRKLSEGIQGLPTRLDEIVANAQRLTVLTGNLDLATDTTLALNNAFLASGATSADASRGLTQYIQQLSKGKPDMQSWRTLQETMGYALNETAKAFGFAGESAQNDLYAALRDGDITFSEFNAKIVELNNATGGFAELAKTSSVGIGTSWTNMQTAVVRGTTAIISSIDSGASRFGGIQGIVEGTGKTFESVLKGIAVAVEPVVANIDILIPTVGGLFVAFKAYTIIQTVTASMKALQLATATVNTLLVTSTSINGLFTASLHATAVAEGVRAAAKSAGMTIDAAGNLITAQGTAATVAQTAAVLASSGVLSAKTVIVGVLTGQIGLATGAQWLWNAAMAANPVGVVVVGVVALGAAIAGLIVWLKRESAESKALKKDIESLSNSNDNLVNSLGSSEQAYQDNIKSIDAQTSASQKLADKIYDLSNMENKSAEDKRLLSAYVDMFNESMGESILAYDAENDALNKTQVALNSVIEARREQAKQQAAQERYIELAKEQYSIEEQLDAIARQYAEAQQVHGEGTNAYTKAVEGLVAQEEELKLKLEENNAAFQYADEVIASSMQVQTEAVVSGVDAQIAALGELDDFQKEVIESMQTTFQSYADAATDMFNTLSDEITITAAEMAANLEENQRVITEWADNIALLAERGIDEGLLNTLRDAGPESAGHVAALVSASDEELSHLSEVFANGAQVATDAFKTAFNIEESGLSDAIIGMVSDTESSLLSQIEAAGWGDIFKSIPEGGAKGIEDGTPDVTAATENMMDEAADAARTAAQSHSPSLVFAAIGNDLVDGLAKGINENSSKATDAFKKWFSDMTSHSTIETPNLITLIVSYFAELPGKLTAEYNRVTEATRQWFSNLISAANSETPRFVQAILTPVKTLPNEFKIIGADMIQGWIDGLTSKESALYDTIARIAREAAETAREELEIESPSKVFSEIGVFSIKGFILGLQSMAANASRAIANVFNMDGVYIPDFAVGNIGGGQLAYAGGASTAAPLTINQYMQTVPQSPYETQTAAVALFQQARW